VQSKYDDQKLRALMDDIERELDEYDAAVNAARDWWTTWKEKNRGFRCKRTFAEGNDDA
jgi:hypothetical protein